MNTKCQLAIVIPFYKVSFFGDLLEALVGQSNRNFNIYIGDDCSLNSPDLIIQKYQGKLNITYHRFKERKGHISLTGQWERCLELVRYEEWVWVIPDDDLPSPNCVEAFYKALKEKGVDNVNVFTIPVVVMDADGLPVTKVIKDPRVQDNYAFYMRQVKGESGGSSLGDNIYRKEALIETGGFVEFPKAWGSDHATILRVSAGKMIYCLESAWFGFRQSGINISSQRDDGEEKMAARVLFALWLKDNEDIFPAKPTEEFYRYFYWKSEYYVVNEWEFSIGLYRILYRLRYICLGSYNPAPLIKLMVSTLLKRRLSI